MYFQTIYLINITVFRNVEANNLHIALIAPTYSLTTPVPFPPCPLSVTFFSMLHFLFYPETDYSKALIRIY
jgi:hypothetical protein